MKLNRQQHVTINKWVIVTEPNHLNGSLIHSWTNHWDSKHRCSCLELFFVCEMQQKQAIWYLKRKYLKIHLLFIELLYKINITFVIMLIFWGKNGTLPVILIIWNVNIYIFCPISWILWSFLMHFNRLNHAVKEQALIARVHCLTSSPQANVCVHSVGVSWVFAKYSILSNCTSLKQQLRYYRRRYISHTPTYIIHRNAVHLRQLREVKERCYNVLNMDFFS